MRTASIVAISALAVHQAAAFLQPSSALVNSRVGAVTRGSQSLAMVASKEEFHALREDLEKLLDRTNCAPIMVRLAWHDAGSYDKNISQDQWPNCGGANGSIQYYPEINHGANAGLSDAFKLLKSIRDKHSKISMADTLQLASATAIKMAGGPDIDMRYGRVDAPGPESKQPEGNLPAAAKPFPDGSPEPQDHLRKVFYRMGFDDRGIVALSGAHTLGRAYPERSGFGKESTKYTDGSSVARGDGKPGIGRKGGQSWTRQWLKFDNSYFADVPENDEDLLKLETDSALFLDDKMRPIALEYKKDEAKFFADYAAAHKKLSELGAKWEVEGGIKI